MILDSLENSALYEPMHPLFARAFEFLRNEVQGLPSGKHVIEGDRLFALVSTSPPRGRDGTKLEAHRKYIDIQYIIKGTDVMGLKPTCECAQIDDQYNPQTDMAVVLDRPTNWVTVPQGSFTIFYPDDSHAPRASDQETTRAIVKVIVDL